MREEDHDETERASMESVKGGPRVSHFAGFPGTLSDANLEDEGDGALGRNGRLKSSLRSSAYLGFSFEYVPSEVGTLAPKSGDPDFQTCPVCRGTFVRRRSDNIYCSPRCRRKGSRLGRAAVEGRMESDSFMQRCQAPGCSNSLAGRTSRAKYCSSACRKRAAYWKRE